LDVLEFDAEDEAGSLVTKMLQLPNFPKILELQSKWDCNAFYCKEF